VQLFVAPPRSVLCGFDVSCPGFLEASSKVLVALCKTGVPQAKVVASSVLSLITDAFVLARPESFPRKQLCGLVSQCFRHAWMSDRHVVCQDAIEFGNRVLWGNQPARRLLTDDATLRTFIEALANVVELDTSCYTGDGSLQLLQESSNWLLEVFAEMVRNCKDADWTVDESEFSFGAVKPPTDESTAPLPKSCVHASVKQVPVGFPNRAFVSQEHGASREVS
jgi:hypothetical protein